MTKRFGMAALLAMLGCVAMVGCGDGGAVKVPDTPDGTVKAVADSLAAGKPQVIWSAMPASYQKDVDGLIKEFAANMDAEIYDKGVGVVKKLTAVLKKQRKFLTASTMTAKSGIDAKKLDASMDTLVAVLDAITSSDIASVKTLKTLDVGKFLAGTGAKVMGSLSELSKLTPGDDYNKGFLASVKGVKVEVVKAAEGKAADDKATVKATSGDGKDTEEIKLVKVEGKWVIEEMAKEWKASMADAKENLAGVSKKMAEAKPKAMAAIAMIEATLDQLLAADSQEKFDQAAGMAMMGIGGMIMGGGGDRPSPPMERPAPGPMPVPTPSAPPVDKK